MKILNDISRRAILKRSARLGAASMFAGGLGSLASSAFASPKDPVLTILHTNDIHSHIDPFPANHPNYPNQGGAARRSTFVNSVRATNPDTLLLDAGDMFMGSLYFTEFEGEADLRVMSQQGYQGGTIGNHEFDAGIEKLADNIRKFARFPLVSANYAVDGSALDGLTTPSTILETPNFRVGIVGVGIKLEGLVAAKMCPGVRYSSPVAAAQKFANILRHDEGCDLVICLSHLGNNGQGREPGEQELAASTHGIDIILGGHSHTFFDIPQLAVNARGDAVIVNQVGWAGLQVGRIDIQRRANKRVAGLPGIEMIQGGAVAMT